MSKMFKIALPDGSVREMPEGSTPGDVAAAIGPGLAKAALAARVDGELRDLNRPFEGDATLALVTARDEKDALELFRHDYAHVLAEAVQNLFPGTQITFGPATDDGFYYDFAPAPGRGMFTEEELPLIEAEMRRVIARDEPLVREEWAREDVRAFFVKQGETYKADWVMELPEGEAITMYRSGHGDDKWMDLCRGPHLPSTGKLDPAAFKLTRVSGAYWRGDQSNAMLSRIYGTAWLNKKPTWCGWKKRPSATIAGSGRRWTCSICRPKRMGRCSGTPRGSSCGACWRPICGGGWMRRAMTRSRRPS
jgi:threonyl-tRNA synthetase